MIDLKQVQAEIDRREADNRAIEKRTGTAYGAEHDALVMRHQSNRQALGRLYLTRDKAERPAMYQR